MTSKHLMWRQLILDTKGTLRNLAAFLGGAVLLSQLMGIFFVAPVLLWLGSLGSMWAQKTYNRLALIRYEIIGGFCVSTAVIPVVLPSGRKVNVPVLHGKKRCTIFQYASQN